jgi:hypothetical protein
VVVTSALWIFGGLTAYAATIGFIGWRAGVKLRRNTPPAIPSRLTVNMDAAAAEWRTIRAIDCVDEALAADARDASEVGDLAALHNIAITRTVVGELRDRMAGAA